MPAALTAEEVKEAAIKVQSISRGHKARKKTAKEQHAARVVQDKAVSYTHLTLPTILLV